MPPAPPRKLHDANDERPLHNEILDLLLDAVCVVDAEGRFTYVNGACESIFGYTREELIGKKMIDLVLPEDRERTLEAAAQVMEGTPALPFENRYQRKDGEVVELAWTASWSESLGVRIGVARDITERKRADEALALAKAQIEHSNRALREANEMLQAPGHHRSPHWRRKPLVFRKAG